MKFSLAIFAAFAAVANAQSACFTSAEAIPPCALGYLASAAYSISSCGVVDFQCQCSISSQVQAAVENTVLAQCGASAASVLNGASALCGCAGSNAGSSISLNSVQSACQASALAIPPCGLGYVADAAKAIGDCALEDFACQCSNAAAVESSVASAVSSACGGSSAVFASAAALCSCVSSGSVGSGGSGSGSTAAMATGTSAAAVGGTTAAPSAASSGAKQTASAAASTALTRFTNAGAVAITAMGGVIGAFAGLLAWL